MTHPIETSEIKRRYDAGDSMAQIKRDLNLPLEVIRCRLKKAGYKPRARRPSVTKAAVRTLRERMPDLVSLLQFLEGDKRKLLRTMGQRPSPDKLERLGRLTDYIETLTEVTK